MKRLSSKKQIILIMMFFLIPLLGLLIGYNLYNINALNQGLAESRQNTILLYSNAFERELKDIENYTASFLANDADSIQMRYQNSILQSHVLTMGILQKYRTMMNAKNVMAAFFSMPATTLFSAELTGMSTAIWKKRKRKHLCGRCCGRTLM